MAALIQHTLHDGVATLTLNRPAQLNALAPELLDELLAALRASEADEHTRAIVLTGAGTAFSAGGDIGWFSQVLAGGVQHAQTEIDHLMRDAGNPLTQAIAECALPVVVAVNGACAGGAVGIALAADMVLAARSAYFLLPQLPQLGVVPDLGATWALARHLGRSRALGLALTGERIDATRAEQWGLIWRCVDDAELLTEATALARRLGALPAAALRDTRGLIDQAPHTPLATQLDAEREMQRQHAGSEFFKQACMRFIQRSGQR